ncbi:MAG TPA: protein-disulfide reductase DsbD [Burkholderiales bacterium]|nr:protein-disulfide reductase DsbD [Burkholderiales bacterium]
MVQLLKAVTGLLLAWTFAPAQAAGDLLPPEAAFRFSAALTDAATIRVHYRIADGYYLYRDRFRTSVDDSAVKLGEPRMPPGVIGEDEFVGKAASYRGEVVFDIPLVSPLPPGGAVLRVVSQGCADAGVCYTPLTQSARLVPVAFADAGPPARKASRLLTRLQSDAPAPQAEAGEEFLPVEKAFAIEARSPDPQTVVVRLSPADTYYLYREKLHFSLVNAAGASIGSVQIPRGEAKQDPNFGKTEVFHRPVQVLLHIRRDGTGKLPITLKVGYQGCSEKGLCYPPATRELRLALAVAGGANEPSTAGAQNAGAGPGSPAGATAAAAEDEKIAGLLGAGNIWLVMASFLGFGLLLSFTPCVLPMIPILSGMIAGQGAAATRHRGFVLSAVYVLGMATAYAAAGVLAGLSGSLLSASMQNPWVLGAFAGVFVVLALSMFGFYDLQLPVSWQSGAAQRSNRLSGGKLAGVFGMGALSAIIVGPCVAAPLAGALLYVSQSRDVVLGGLALFMLALGMGLPLLVVGASTGALLPKAGAWMQSVKNFFGVLLLATAIWILSPLLTLSLQMACWAALLIACGIFLRAIDPLPVDAGPYRRLWKGAGIVALVAGVSLLVGALAGSRDPLRPLAGIMGSSARTESPAATPFVRVASLGELEKALAGAGRPAMLDFYADWCVSCEEMERLTFRDADVRREFSSMLLLQADVTANSAADQALLRRFGLFGPPGIIFFDREGNEIAGSRVVGYQPASKFLPALRKVTAE